MRLLIVDDHQLIIDGLNAIFSKDPAITIVGTAHNGQEALNFLNKIDVDIVLTDIDMPEMGGIQLVKAIRDSDLKCKVVIMTMHNEKPLVTEILTLGAEGFLLKSASEKEMQLAIKAVHEGSKYVSSEITEIILKPDLVPAQKTVVDLSKREIQILQLIAEGFTNKEIGEKIFISHRTVDKHRANMMSKIEAKNIAELVRYAMRNELIE